MSSTKVSDTTTITEHETQLQQLDRANAAGLTPVVFIHGLWLLPSSWGHVRQGGVTAQRHPDHQLAATSSPVTSSTASPSITSSRALASDSALM